MARSSFFIGISTAAAIAAATQAGAQTLELPPIVVQGATLEVPKPRREASPGGDTAPGAVAPDSGAAATSDRSGDERIAGVPIDELGSAVTVVTGAELKAQQVRHVADALRSLPGVSVSRTGGFDGVTQVRMRGAEGNQTLVLIDGIEANDTSQGEFNFSDLPVDDIERIEVIRGPQSGLYGSNAVGGVINIITKSGRGPLTFSARTEAGSFGTVDGSVRVSGGTDRVWGALSVGTRRTDGFNLSEHGSEEDGSKLSAFSLRGGARLLDGVTLDFTLRHTSKEGDRDTQAPFPDPSGIQVDDPATFKETTFLGGVKLTWESLDGHLTQVVKANRNETHRTDHDPTSFFDGDNLDERITYGYTATYRFETPTFVRAKHALTGLVEKEREMFTPSSTLADSVERERNRVAFAAEYRGEFADRLFVTGAVRHDDNDVFQDFDTWRATATVKLPEIGIRPHASVGTAVKFPSMFDQFGFIPAFFIPNPNLAPEESFGWDAGVEFTLIPNRAFLDVTYFDADLRNKLATVGFPSTPINLPGKSTREGIEFAGRWLVSPALSLGAAYTYLDAKNPDGFEEIRRPPHSARFDANYVFDAGKGVLNLAVVYNGDMKDTNFGTFETVTLDDYWLVNVAASYRVAPGVELFGRVENALNQDYQEVFGFATAGIAAFAGVRFTYEEPATASWARYR